MLTRLIARTGLALATLPLLHAAAQAATAQDDGEWQRLYGQNGESGYQHRSGNGIVILVDRPDTAGQPLVQQVRAVAGPMTAPTICPRMRTAPFTAGPVAGAIALEVQAPDNGFTCSATAIQSGGRTIIALSMEGTNGGVDSRGFARRQFDAALANAPAGVRANAPAHAPAIARPATPAPSTAPTARLRPPPASGAVASAPRGLVGMWRADWVENQYVWPTGLTLLSQNRSLIFTAGGLFMDGVGTGYSFDDEGARARAAREPDQAGRYSVSGSSITLSFASGRQERITQVRGASGPMLRANGHDLAPKLTFPDGYRLSGTYSSQRISNAGGGTFVVGDSDLSFAPDGRFARGGQVSVSANVGSGTGRQQGRTGRYEVRGSALHLRYDDGGSEILSMFQETRGREIWFDNQLYRPTR